MASIPVSEGDAAISEQPKMQPSSSALFLALRDKLTCTAIEEIADEESCYEPFLR
jgi:hypothetical protein